MRPGRQLHTEWSVLRRQRSMLLEEMQYRLPALSRG